MTIPVIDGRDTMISIRDVSVSFGAKRVLAGVSLDVYRGEIVVLLGGSGSGKTTLLKQVLGLAKPDTGSITIIGTPITSCTDSDLATVRRRIGVAFQGAALFNSLSVADNVALPLQELTGLADSTIKLMVWMKLKAVGMEDASELYPRELSGGMRKRAAIARAIALDPDILVFDEPSAGLDPIVAAELDELILFLKRALGMTILVVTHDLESAFHIADRMAMLNQGHLIAVDTTERFRTNTHPLIRQFLDRRARPSGREQKALSPHIYGSSIMSTEAKVGAFVLVSLLVLGTTIYFVHTTHNLKGQVAFKTYFRYAGGLAPGAPVLFGGIKVGQVTAVRPSTRRSNPDRDHV